MGLNVGNLPVKQVYVGSTPVTAAYVGAEKIWPTTEVVQITLGTGWQARDQLRATLTARGLNYRTVTEIPFDIELVGSGSTMELFDGCSALTSVPDLDTSQVTDMYLMFYGCAALTYVPDLHTAQVTNMGYMFQNCSSLTDGNVRLIGRHPNVNTTGMITGSGLTREPFVVQITLGTSTEARDQFRAVLAARGLDYGTVTEIPFDIELVGTGAAVGMFNGCAALTSVPDMDTSQVTNMNSMFNGCAALTHAPALDTGQVTNMGYMFTNCSALTHIPDMDTSQVTNMGYMFRNCSALTDGNVRLIGRHPNVATTDMITGSGLTREPFYDAAGNPI